MVDSVSYKILNSALRPFWEHRTYTEWEQIYRPIVNSLTRPIGGQIQSPITNQIYEELSQQ